jgi:hypothetical protein
MKNIVSFIIAALPGALATANAKCITTPSYSKTQCFKDGCVERFNDSRFLGGNGKIDKIEKIEVYAGKYFTKFVISQLKITYKMIDGSTETLTHGRGGKPIGTYELFEGQYLKTVQLRTGDHLDWIQFCRASDMCSPRFGGNTSSGPNGIISASDGVVHSFFGQDGAVIDRLGAYIEHNRLYKVVKEAPIFTESAPPHVIRDLPFSDPDATITVDALNLSSPVIATLFVAETLETTETTTVTAGQTFSVASSVATNVEIPLKVVDASVESTFSVGSSWTTEEVKGESYTFAKTIVKEFAFSVQPGTRVQATLFYKKVRYAYDFEGRVSCFYTFDKDRKFDGANEKGTTIGEQVFSEPYPVFSEERSSRSPAKSPTKAPTAAPTVANCRSATYRSWTKAPPGGVTKKATIRSGSTVCIKHPYNIQLQLACPAGTSPSLPVTFELLNGRRRVVRRQVEDGSAPPFLLWGGPGAAGGLYSPGRLPDGTYYLQSSAAAGPVRFTQKCS